MCNHIKIRAYVNVIDISTVQEAAPAKGPYSVGRVACKPTSLIQFGPS